MVCRCRVMAAVPLLDKPRPPSRSLPRGRPSSTNPPPPGVLKRYVCHWNFDEENKPQCQSVSVSVTSRVLVGLLVGYGRSSERIVAVTTAPQHHALLHALPPLCHDRHESFLMALRRALGVPLSNCTDATRSTWLIRLRLASHRASIASPTSSGTNASTAAARTTGAACAAKPSCSQARYTSTNEPTPANGLTRAATARSPLQMCVRPLLLT